MDTAHISGAKTASPELAERVQRTISERGIAHIHLQFTDVLGTIKAVTIPAEALGDAIAHGTWFDGSSLDSHARTAESDMYLVPDLSTFAIPGSGDTARVICAVHNPDGTPDLGDPRRVLQDAVDSAAKLGFAFHAGAEVEFYLVRHDQGGTPVPLPSDRAGYFDFSTDLGAVIRREAAAALRDLGIDVNATHHEVAEGQHEIDLGHLPAVAAADSIITLRYVVAEAARRHGVLATFMPKPFTGRSGSGMHVHQSLFNGAGENAFSDAASDYGISELARQFIAGQLHHARAMTAVLAPIINSYKRLGRGFEAPIFVSWARTNRGALIRVPQVGRSEAVRVELRNPDPSCNPYMALAVMLRCGLDGIERGLTPPPAVEESLWGIDEIELRRQNVELLPESLREALDLFEKDDVVLSALGDQICERFVESKLLELREYSKQVTPWELATYLEWE